MPITLDGTSGIASPGYGAVSGTTGTFSGNVTANGLSTELRPLVLGTSQASTSGTSIDFTGIPSWVKRVTVMLNGVSVSGTSNLLLQIGSGSVQNTGYVAGATQSNNATVQTSTAGFVLTSGLIATAAFHGNIILALVTGNTWNASGVLWNTGSAGHTNAGTVSLSGAIDRVRITTVGGTDTFDAGSINIMYE